MTTSLPSENTGPRDAPHWTRTSTLHISQVPTGALNLNVDGRQVVGPLQGFGPLWQRTYSLTLSEASLTPAEMMNLWKAHFPSFLPPKQRFYPTMNSLEPGQIILINGNSGLPVSTGIMVLYADEETFTLMTPQGHPESGWNTFSVLYENDRIICQIQSLARASDPLYELGFRLLGSSVQERIWIHVLEALATHLQMSGQIQTSKSCIDPHIQWSQAKNIWYNAAIRTVFYKLSVLPYKLIKCLKRHR
jgi:hypothetical protein